jgi:hypothetical protein
MKALAKFLLVALTGFAAIIFNSCEFTNNVVAEKGIAEFSLNIPEGMLSKSASDSIESAFQVLISVEDLDSNIIFQDKLIPVYSFGSGFVSESVEINAGEYRLTKFMVINTSGAVIYAAPLSGSPLAYLCTRPLPLIFSIAPGQTTRVVPEVLVVGDQTPDKFGYATFGIQVIKPLEFWTMCVLDPGNPMIMAPIQITTANLTVLSPDGWHFKFKLDSRINHILIRGGFDNYIFILEKEGFRTQKFEVRAIELTSTRPDSPYILRIPWESQYKVLVLQPGPEKGKDAMISNLEPEKNFGNHKYFEATFLSEPVLTVMRSNRSLIWFNPDSLPKSVIIKKVTLTLTYDLPIPFDSTYITTNTGPVSGIAWYGAVLQQVIEPWEEYKVTWNNQPKTIELNQVYISPFIRNTNMIQVDVTKLFVNPATTDGASYPNYGMLFKTWPVDRFPGFRFASSDYPVANMRPRLTIYYTL